MVRGEVTGSHLFPIDINCKPAGQVQGSVKNYTNDNLYWDSTVPLRIDDADTCALCNSCVRETWGKPNSSGSFCVFTPINTLIRCEHFLTLYRLYEPLRYSEVIRAHCFKWDVKQFFGRLILNLMLRVGSQCKSQHQQNYSELKERPSFTYCHDSYCWQ